MKDVLFCQVIVIPTSIKEEYAFIIDPFRRARLFCTQENLHTSLHSTVFFLQKGFCEDAKEVGDLQGIINLSLIHI